MGRANACPEMALIWPEEGQTRPNHLAVSKQGGPNPDFIQVLSPPELKCSRGPGSFRFLVVQKYLSSVWLGLKHDFEFGPMPIPA